MLDQFISGKFRIFLIRAEFNSFFQGFSVLVHGIQTFQKLRQSGANVIDVGKTSLVIEMTGSKSKLSALIDLLGEYEILELARTGITGLSRGASDVKFL